VHPQFTDHQITPPDDTLIDIPQGLASEKDAMVAIGKQKGMGIVQVVKRNDSFLDWDVWIASKNRWQQRSPFSARHQSIHAN
jgi:hypothetical protein